MRLFCENGQTFNMPESESESLDESLEETSTTAFVCRPPLSLFSEFFPPTCLIQSYKTISKST